MPGTSFVNVQRLIVPSLPPFAGVDSIGSVAASVEAAASSVAASVAASVPAASEDAFAVSSFVPELPQPASMDAAMTPVKTMANAFFFIRTSLQYIYSCFPLQLSVPCYILFVSSNRFRMLT